MSDSAPWTVLFNKRRESAGDKRGNFGDMPQRHIVASPLSDFTTAWDNYAEWKLIEKLQWLPCIERQADPSGSEETNAEWQLLCHPLSTCHPRSDSSVHQAFEVLHSTRQTNSSSTIVFTTACYCRYAIQGGPKIGTVFLVRLNFIKY